MLFVASTFLSVVSVSSTFAVLLVCVYAESTVLLGVLLFGVWDLCLVELGTTCMVAGGIVIVFAFLYGRSCCKVLGE